MRKRDVIVAVLAALLLLLTAFIATQLRAEAGICSQNIGVICNYAAVYADTENGGRMPARFSSNWLDLPLSRLICPRDSSRHRASSGSSFTDSNTSYVILGPGISVTDFTSFVTVFLLRSKSETMQHMKHYIDMIETAPGHKRPRRIMKFRSDRGGEFKSHEFENYLKSRGIIHEFSAPYVHQQNGRAERINRTLREKAESM